MDLTIIFILVLFFCTVSFITYYLASLLNRKINSISKRLTKVTDTHKFSDFKEELRKKSTASKKKINPKLEKVTTTLTKISPSNEKTESRLRQSLMQAGWYRENSVKIFLGLKILFAITIFAVYGLLGYIGGRGFLTFLIAVIMALMGYMLPDLLLTVKIRKRQDELAGGLPDALDFLVICVEAGLGLNSALIRVGQEMRLRCKALSEELLLVNQEMRTGATREQALYNLRNRNNSKELRTLVGAVVLSDRLGTNIADTLRAQSDSLRTRVRQRAEERAAKAGIKLLFPLVFFIMPALFIAILGPGIILVIKTLIPVIQK